MSSNARQTAPTPLAHVRFIGITILSAASMGGVAAELVISPADHVAAYRLLRKTSAR